MGAFVSYTVRHSGRTFQFPFLDHASWRFDAHPDGSGTSWEEDVDVDRPHGLDYRYSNHIAKAVRKRSDKEHEAYGDTTAGGEHVPGWCKVLKHVDGTADVSGAADATLFQYNGLVHSMGNQSLWCITGAVGDPTVLLLDPNTQYKGGDITWTGAQEFDASVDFTTLHVDASAEFAGKAQFDGTVNFDGAADFTDVRIDGTLDVYDRADFSSMGVSGDVTFSGGVEFDGAVKIDGSVQVEGLMSFCANNVYDSSWFDASRGSANSLTHDLSSTVLLTKVYFKDVANQVGTGANRIYDLENSHSEDGIEKGAVITNITTTQLTAQAGQDYVAAPWNATGVMQNCVSGQYRVIAMRLV